jgi:hypothetical protein
VAARDESGGVIEAVSDEEAVWAVKSMQRPLNTEVWYRDRRVGRIPAHVDLVAEWPLATGKVLNVVRPSPAGEREQGGVMFRSSHRGEGRGRGLEDPSRRS